MAGNAAVVAAVIAPLQKELDTAIVSFTHGSGLGSIARGTFVSPVYRGGERAEEWCLKADYNIMCLANNLLRTMAANHLNVAAYFPDGVPQGEPGWEEDGWCDFMGRSNNKELRAKVQHLATMPINQLIAEHAIAA